MTTHWVKDTEGLCLDPRTVTVSSVFSQPKELMGVNGVLLNTCQNVGSPLVEDNVSVSSVGCPLASLKPVGFAGEK